MRLSLTESSEEFLRYLDTWLDTLPTQHIQEIVLAPASCALISVDVIKGFCAFGPLSSERVNRIVLPVVELIRLAWENGMRNILLTQDSHEADAVEFGQWPPHCVRGSEESEAVDELQSLPFFDQLLQIPKNSIHSGLNTGLSAWLAAHPEVHTFIVVGDCTDLCTYQLAMHLRLDANARQIQRRVIVPVNAVDTYDRPVAAAEEQGGFPHPGGLLHAVFLYHMALNGVELAAAIN